MSKKKKIIISCVSVAVILISIILTLILVNIKRYSNYTDMQVQYNNHETMKRTHHGSELIYNYNSTIYLNGTRIVERASGTNAGKYGIYSYNSGGLVVDTEYDAINEHAQTSYATYFSLYDAAKPNNFNFVNQLGQPLGITKYDAEKNECYATIKAKNVETYNKRGKVKTNISRKFTNKTVAIADINFEDYIEYDNIVTYEMWDIETTDGMTYRNIYKINGHKRELIQTLGSINGLSIETEQLMVSVMSNGELRFATMVALTDDDNGPIEFTYYNDEYKEKGRFVIQGDFISNAVTQNRILTMGNTIIMQVATPATQDNYDYIDYNNSETNYYNVETKKIDIKSGKLSNINFKYLITDSNQLNKETTIISAREIKNEKLEDSSFHLINERVQVKQVDYFIDSLIKINKDRFLGYNEDTKEYVLLNKRLKMICRLGSTDEIFTTNNAIIIYKNDHALVCNLNGEVITSYHKDNIINLYHEKYYMVIVNTTKEGVPYQEYYLENLGLRGKKVYENPTSGGNSYVIDGVSYVGFQKSHTKDLSLMIRIKETSPGNYTYEICTYDGKILKIFDNLASSGMSISVAGSTGEDFVIVTFNGEYYVIDK